MHHALPRQCIQPTIAFAPAGAGASDGEEPNMASLSAGTSTAVSRAARASLASQGAGLLGTHRPKPHKIWRKKYVKASVAAFEHGCTCKRQRLPKTIQHMKHGLRVSCAMLRLVIQRPLANLIFFRAGCWRLGPWQDHADPGADVYSGRAPAGELGCSACGNMEKPMCATTCEPHMTFFLCATLPVLPPALHRCMTGLLLQRANSSATQTRYAPPSAGAMRTTASFGFTRCRWLKSRVYVVCLLVHREKEAMVERLTRSSSQTSLQTVND
eukprot:30173-Chlamydomonas_euryale.AAC.5